MGRFLSLLVLALLVVSTGRSGVKSIEQVFPRCGQQGTVVDVEIWGVSLDDPKEIIFYQPGIRAYDFAISEEPPKRRNLAHGGYWDQAVTCKFEIAPDCPPRPVCLSPSHEKRTESSGYFPRVSLPFD